MGKKITITAKDGYRLGAYLAEPQSQPRGGVVICQEIFGVNEYLKSACEFYAAAGYLTIAPQFFDRFEPDVALDYTPEGRQRAGEFLARTDWNVALEDLDVARQSLRSLGTAKVGIVGYCWGGTLAWLLACRGQVDCAVAYYPSEIDDFPGEHARHPVILHMGEADRTIPAEKLRRIQEAQAGTPMYLYPGAPHGFDNSIRHGHEMATAKLARERTLEFLAQHVG
jgi:carboxymethylenebutenolidase